MVLAKLAKYKCDCHFNSQIAYITKDLNQKPTKYISIKTFLNNKQFQKKVKSNEIYLVCSKGKELIKYSSNRDNKDNKKKRRVHFKHKVCNNCGISDWHREWQTHFRDTEVKIGCRRADAVIYDNIYDNILEFQHSWISKKDINERTQDYINMNKKVLWVVECNGVQVEEICGKYVLTFCKVWKYENFSDLDYIYLDVNEIIFKIEPKLVKVKVVVVGSCLSKDEFIKYIKNKTLDTKWINNKVDQGMIYFNQRGAGCGKTYESIQLLEKNPSFQHKNTFIYLTKLHSAKDVIYTELKEQEDRGAISKLVFNQKDGELGELGKQYKITYYNSKSDKFNRIMIGTLDSFMYALGNTNTSTKVSGANYFQEIAKTIRDGYVNITKTGEFKLSKKQYKLNAQTLVIIDEAQDLDDIYIQTFYKIIKITGLDTYIIGDKLQSIWSNDNLYTFLEKDDSDLQKYIKKSAQKNKVMRFHNIKFKGFVNSIIDFKKYNLIPIEEICDRDDCIHCNCTQNQLDIDPYKLFEMPNIRSDCPDYNKIELFIQKLIGYVDSEVNKNDYLPKNFMFICPYISKNPLAHRLEESIQEYWIKKFRDKGYSTILDKKGYWDKVDRNRYIKFVYLHKSDEGKSINLRESENATRILSIHSSKGNGAEVVFLLGVTENILRIYSKKTGNLVYDSLLHVGITRQKRSLYIGLVNNGDDIWRKFKKKNDIERDVKTEPDLNHIKSTIEYNRIISDTLENDNTFDLVKRVTNLDYYECILLKDDYVTKPIIDMGHHLIRYCVFYYNIMYNIVKNETFDDQHRDQFKTILRKISKLVIIEHNCKSYQNALFKINRINKKQETFPILTLSLKEDPIYFKYPNSLKLFIRSIQEKIRVSMFKRALPTLCPMETVILLHMIDIYDNGYYADISIMDVYSIMLCYDECSDTIKTSHSEEKCLCARLFNGDTNSNKYKEIRSSIKNHYERVECVKSIYQKYNNYIKNILLNPTFKYNVSHMTYFGEKNKNFKIYKKFSLIAHSDRHVILFIIKPQFNKLNFNQIFFEAVFNEFLIGNTDPDSGNFIRYCKNSKDDKNKEIITCIFTLDSDEPIIFKLKIKDEMSDQLKKCIKRYLLNKYSEYHDKMYNYFKFYQKSLGTVKSVNYICSILDKDKYDDNFPIYIRDYFQSIRRDLRRIKNPNKLSSVLERIENREYFLEELNTDLYMEIEEFQS